MKELGNRCVRFRSRERKGVETRKTGIELPAGDLAPRARFVPMSRREGVPTNMYICNNACTFTDAGKRNRQRDYEEKDNHEQHLN